MSDAGWYSSKGPRARPARSKRDPDSPFSLDAPSVLRDLSPICHRGRCGRPRVDGSDWCQEHADEFEQRRAEVLAEAPDTGTARREIAQRTRQ
jgi:hypothetical protein